jgi:hypothetical protein
MHSEPGTAARPAFLHQRSDYSNSIPQQLDQSERALVATARPCPRGVSIKDQSPRCNLEYGHRLSFRNTPKPCHASLCKHSDLHVGMLGASDQTCRGSQNRGIMQATSMMHGMQQLACSTAALPSARCRTRCSRSMMPLQAMMDRCAINIHVSSITV